MCSVNNLGLQTNNLHFHTPLPALLLGPTAVGGGKGVCLQKAYVFSKQTQHLLNFKIHCEQIQAQPSF